MIHGHTFHVKSLSAFRLSAALAFVGVVLGAFGAHALQERLTAFDTVKIWSTASLYHLVHSVALLVISRDYAVYKMAWWSFFVGVLIFSGSLYLLAVTDIRWLGAITPLGGLGFLLGWGSLVFNRAAKD